MKDTRDIALRINAIYNNEKTVKFLGFAKDKTSGEKVSYFATIFKYDQEGNETDAFMDMKLYMPVKGDLILTEGYNFSVWKDMDQYVVGAFTGVLKSNYTLDEVRTREWNKFLEQLGEAPKVEAPKQEVPIDEVPWELDL